ncbi:MAG: HAMP domain-containing protein [Acidobacteria bacterium]|nr:HAMP domain-containing protein [Acidobacteriota bacterium]MBI3663765.1 HAMP domain-containing protein [Acidobacteriota bacterium]
MSMPSQNPPRTPRRKPGKITLAVGGLLVALLLAAVFTLGSLRIPFEPDRWQEFLILYAVSTFMVAALLVFGLIFARTLLRTWAERRAETLGGRFKTKMVAGAMAIALLPVVFMFLISYALLNRTLNRWFPRPIEIATEESTKLLKELGVNEGRRLTEIADLSLQGKDFSGTNLIEKDLVKRALSLGADAAWVQDEAGNVQQGLENGRIYAIATLVENKLVPISPKKVSVLPSSTEVWQESHDATFLAARPSRGSSGLVVGMRMPDQFLDRYQQIEAQAATYNASKQSLRAYKNQLLLTLALFTVLLLFSAMWFALFLSKQVVLPIQALADATREISRGNFDYRVDVPARDELGTLVSSFNQMTAQLATSRQQINEFTRSLQDAVTELERRRKLMEAILENIPTAVLSLDDNGGIRRANPSVTKIFGDAARDAKTLEALAGEEAARGLQQLMRKSLRMGAASKELAITLPNRVLHAAVTVSSLGPRRANPGFVVVIDDLTDLLHAQKSAAWQEVAQRIAHEIKNPLTPIQLSAQRLSRYIEKQKMLPAASGVPSELELLTAECAGLIQREVTALKTLVDEFSQFARFPTVKPVFADLNAIVTSALDVFGGRLEGVTLRTTLAPGLPPAKADPELLRRVLVNVIDNAAEALEGSSVKEIAVSTRLDAAGESFEIVIADSGHGISPEDKDHLFLPHFSTRERGTGLGLAIASRIVAEHHGTIRVEDNVPIGARFVIRLPAVEVTSAAANQP